MLLKRPKKSKNRRRSVENGVESSWGGKNRQRGFQKGRLSPFLQSALERGIGWKMAANILRRGPKEKTAVRG